MTNDLERQINELALNNRQLQLERDSKDKDLSLIAKPALEAIIKAETLKEAQKLATNALNKIERTLPLKQPVSAPAEVPKTTEKPKLRQRRANNSKPLF